MKKKAQSSGRTQHGKTPGPPKPDTVHDSSPEYDMSHTTSLARPWWPEVTQQVKALRLRDVPASLNPALPPPLTCRGTRATRAGSGAWCRRPAGRCPSAAGRSAWSRAVARGAPKTRCPSDAARGSPWRSTAWSAPRCNRGWRAGVRGGVRGAARRGWQGWGVALRWSHSGESRSRETKRRQRDYVAE